MKKKASSKVKKKTLKKLSRRQSKQVADGNFYKLIINHGGMGGSA